MRSRGLVATGATLCALITALAPETAGQVHSLTPEQMARFTPLNKYERFADGRPKVPDALVETIRQMGIDVEEAWGLLRQKGFTNQYEANWKVLQPDKKLVGRAFTVQFMPARPDVAEASQKAADEKGMGRLRNQTAIDMLQSGDVAVVDLFGKVEGARSSATSSRTTSTRRQARGWWWTARCSTSGASRRRACRRITAARTRDRSRT